VIVNTPVLPILKLLHKRLNRRICASLAVLGKSLGVPEFTARHVLSQEDGHILLAVVRHEGFDLVLALVVTHGLQFDLVLLYFLDEMFS